MLRFLTAGESHGRALVVILEGLPAGLAVDVDAITRDLRRRQGGYGRGRRMAIESDRADILSGVRAGETLGSPVAMTIENRDWPNWQYTMGATAPAAPAAGGASRGPRTRPRAASASAPPRGPVPGPPILPPAPSTSATICATSSSAPARAKPRRASPP